MSDLGASASTPGSRAGRDLGGRAGPAPAALDLAACGEQDPRRDQCSPLDHRLRQLAAAGRAADRAPQRAAGRASGRADRGLRAARPGDGSVRRLQRPGRQRHAGHRPGPPRLGQQGAAGADRGRPEVGPAALRGGHLLPRARHRHGGGGRSGPGRVAAVGGQRSAAGRPGRAPGRGHLPRGVLPQSPRRSDRVGGGGGADAPGGHRGGRRAAQSRSTCSRSRSSPWSRWSRPRSRSCTRWSGGPAASASCRTAPSRPCWTC